MKTPLLLSLVLAAGLNVVPAAQQVSESDAEFFASSDFDNDGRTDSLIIDKAAGVLRIGYQTAAETWTWVPARPAGAVPVTAAAVGRFFGPVRDDIAVASPSANRVLFHSASSVSSAGVPVVRFPLVGPAALAPVGLLGFGARDQMLVGSAIDPESLPYVLAAFDPPGSVPALLPQDAILHQGQPIVLKTGLSTNAAFLADGPGGLELRVYDGVVAAPPVLVVDGVAAGAHYASANFDTASSLAQVIFWVPGAPELYVRPVTEPAAGTFTSGSEVTHTLSGNIAQIVILNDATGPRLLVIFNEGTSAGVFTFDGSSPPVPVTTLTPAAGERFRAATLSGGGSFVLASSPAATARSQTFRPYRRASVSAYTALASASLPNVTTNAGRANVLLFADPPFVDESARPLAALHAGDWTRSISIVGGTVSAVAETFAGTATGLDNPVTISLGAVAAGADEVLANQFEPYLSISSLRAVYDTPDIEPAIAPMPGAFDTAQPLSFSAPAGVTVYFRIGAGAWQTWAGGLQWLTEDTTVSYYGMDGSLRMSALRTADYTFPKEGPFLDSDNDGVPDFVEIAYGLDPRDGPDSDGDAWTDDAEMLAGTDPNSAGDPPPGAILPPRAANAGVNLTITLRSWRGGVPDPSIYPQPGTRVDAINTAATLLATRIIPGMIPATDSVVMENLAVPRETRFISLTTAPSWNREELGVVTYASQSIAIVPAPPPPPPLVINYVPGGGAPAAEAAAWIAALAGAEAAQTPRDIAATQSPVDSLVALLVENKIDEILISRGADAATRLSMFNTGLTDAGARRVTPAQLAALELSGPANEPAWRLDQMYSVIAGAVQEDPGSAEVQVLRTLAADIFEQFDGVWQAPSEADPDGNTAAFPAPIDLLRAIVRGEVIPQGYLDVTTLPAVDIAAAQAAISSILALPASRPEITLTLTARADSWRADCTVLNDGAAPVALVGRDGKPWRFQGSIALPEGALVQVRGFTDRPPPPPACADSTLEVISATVQTLPGGTITDSDADGLGDEWELVFFGSLSQTGGGDFDSDGFTNAQERAAGTDPAGRSTGSPGPLFQPLPIPDPGIALNGAGMVELTWECTEECRTYLRYSLECDPGLEGDWEVRSTSPEFLPDGRMRFTIEPDVSGRCFFRIRVTQP